jgi:hypothetical protein
MILMLLLVQHVAGHVDVDGMDTSVAPAEDILAFTNGACSLRAGLLDDVEVALEGRYPSGTPKPSSGMCPCKLLIDWYARLGLEPLTFGSGVAKGGCPSPCSAGPFSV